MDKTRRDLALKLSEVSLWCRWVLDVRWVLDGVDGAGWCWLFWMVLTICYLDVCGAQDLVAEGSRARTGDGHQLE
jgi:hypothetical protein